jgi:hypothetical protein
MEKSANKQWKESGSTLTFKEWVDRENKKKDSMPSNFLPFDSSTSVGQTQQQIADSIKVDIQNSEDIMGAYRYNEDKSKFLGLDKTTFIFSGLLIIGSLTYFFIKRAKANK